MLVTVAVLSMQPWSSCRGAAFTGPPTLNSQGGGGSLVPSMRKQHRWAQFNVLSSTLFSGGGGEAQLFNLHVILTDTQSACLLYYPTQPGVLSQKLSSAILENSKSRSTQKNSNPCYSWLFMYCDFSIFFYYLVLICLLFISLHLLFTFKRFSYIFSTQSRSKYTHIHLYTHSITYIYFISTHLHSMYTYIHKYTHPRYTHKN